MKSLFIMGVKQSLYFYRFLFNIKNQIKNTYNTKLYNKYKYLYIAVQLYV